MPLPPLNGYMYNILIRSIEALYKSSFAFQATNKDNNKHVMRRFNMTSHWGGIVVKSVYHHQAHKHYHFS